MKTTLSFLMIFVFPVMLHAQSRGWEVDLGIAGTLSGVTLLQVTADSLVMEVSDRTKAIELSWVNKLERRDDPSRIPKFIVGGTIIGGLTGFVVGSLTDHETDDNSNNKKFSYGAIGGIFGGSLGTIIALASGITTHDLSRMSIVQKHTLIDSIIKHDSESHSPLIDSSSLQGAHTSSTVMVHHDSSKPAQKFVLSAGLSFPVGNFGDELGGGAKTGFALTAELSVGRGPSWISSISVSVNGLNNPEVSLPPEVQVSYGSWWTLWPMTGIKISNNVTPKVALYFQGHIGFVIGMSPEISASDQSTSVVIPSDGSTSIAVGLGGGIIIKDRYVLGGRFLYGKPEYEIGPGGTFNARVEQSTSLLLFTFGVVL